jgi:homogentisate 1,2-dioxygenase
MSIHKVDVASAAAQLSRPFLLGQIAQVDHFALYLYLCEGAVARHRHLAQDELFYVHSGILSLDTDWGRIALDRRELAVVPRGLAHQSSSLVHTCVILFQAQGDPERKNGHGRLDVEQGTGPLPKRSVIKEADRIPQAYLPVPLAQADEMSLRLIWCQGDTPWHKHSNHDELLWVEDGRLEVGTEEGPVSVHEDELIVIPRDRIHRVTSIQHTIALSLVHGEVSPLAQMGF